MLNLIGSSLIGMRKKQLKTSYYDKDGSKLLFLYNVHDVYEVYSVYSVYGVYSVYSILSCPHTVHTREGRTSLSLVLTCSLPFSLPLTLPTPREVSGSESGRI